MLFRSEQAGTSERSVVRLGATEVANAGAEIEEQGRLTRHVDGDARRVAAVADDVVAVAGGGAPHAEERDPHAHIARSDPLGREVTRRRLRGEQAVRVTCVMSPARRRGYVAHMTDLSLGSITANGVDFAHLSCGDGPLALCLHGFPDSAHGWRHLLPALAAAGYREIGRAHV